ncbi:hypothetical protein ABGN05_02665 [Aquibium sp. LZ166]|uniref:Uncharacterized protein n=1 Tax=Aquibium pacificus TaxID=3153579 RepID=A0ABV3SES7_9HYPH
MPLRNRVDPSGEIYADTARGMFTGNRGVIHDPATKTLLSRRWTTKAWIVCLCDFRGRRREVMGRNAPSGGAGWTELFFLDEVTALAAGHRPCFYCRRRAAKEFVRCFAAARGLPTVTAPEMDAVLHTQRCASDGASINVGDVRSLPDGTMVASAGKYLAVRDGRLLEWSFEGYRVATPASETMAARLLTPPATVATLNAGYQPIWHGSAS